jgi:hypothetical protein
MTDPTSNIPRPHPGHGAGPSGASLSDILTAVQHVASNIATAADRYMRAQGTGIGAALTAATVLKQGSGRVVMVSVTASGSATGEIIDATLASATHPVIAIIPATVGPPFNVNLPFKFGLLVVPGAGMTVTVSYS